MLVVVRPGERGSRGEAPLGLESTGSCGRTPHFSPLAPELAAPTPEKSFVQENIIMTTLNMAAEAMLRREAA